MDKVPLCIVGCGGMGQRHMLGYRALEDSGIGNIEVVAVCDVRPESAAFGAREIERLFGNKPMVFTDLDDVLAQDGIAALDVVTIPSTHQVVAVPALLAGKHTIVEKPLGITVRACQAIIDAAKQGGTVLATAENFRRDPPNRLARSIIDHGLLGDPYLMLEIALGGSDRMVITPWRHQKEHGASGLDVFVHFADIVQYYMGEFAQIFGTGMIVEPVRHRPDDAGMDLESYRERLKTMPETVESTGEDSVLAMFRMESGATVQFSCVSGGRGARVHERSVHGREGSLYSPGDRNGGQVVLMLGDRELRGKDILPLVPDLQLSEISERLYGKRAVEYHFDDYRQSDARNIALEVHDFADSILSGHDPEVGGYLGMTALSAVVGTYESMMAGRAVTMDQVISGQVHEYQDDIDEALGLK